MSRNSKVGGRVQVSFGFAWSADGYASANKSNCSYQGVGQHQRHQQRTDRAGADLQRPAGPMRTSSGSIRGGYGGGMDGNGGVPIHERDRLIFHANGDGAVDAASELVTGGLGYALARPLSRASSSTNA